MDHVPVARTVDTTSVLSTHAAGRRRGYGVSLRGLSGRRAWALGPVLAISALSCYLKSNGTSDGHLQKMQDQNVRTIDRDGV